MLSQLSYRPTVWVYCNVSRGKFMDEFLLYVGPSFSFPRASVDHTEVWRCKLSRGV